MSVLNNILLFKYRYLLVGIINTLLFYLNSCLLIFVGFSAYLAQIIAAFLSIFINFYTYKFLLFSGKKKGSISKFLFNHLTNYAVSYCILFLMLNYISSNQYISTGLTISIVAIINYFIIINWVFKK
jgi:putative flippase GtrA